MDNFLLIRLKQSSVQFYKHRLVQTIHWHIERPTLEKRAEHDIPKTQHEMFAWPCIDPWVALNMEIKHKDQRQIRDAGLMKMLPCRLASFTFGGAKNVHVLSIPFTSTGTLRVRMNVVKTQKEKRIPRCHLYHAPDLMIPFIYDDLSRSNCS